MSTSPVVFDAGISLGRAVARLEALGIWSSPDRPGCREAIEQLVSHRRFTQAEAEREFGRRVEETWVAIRVLVATRVTWYAMRCRELFRDAGDGNSELSLLAALRLAERETTPVCELTDPKRPKPEYFIGLVLDQGLPVAIHARPKLRASGSGVKFSRGAGAEGGFQEASDHMDYMVRANGGHAAPEPTRIIEAYPRIEAPESVRVGDEFNVEIGLSPAAMAKVTGSRMRIERPGNEVSFPIDLQVIAEGFENPTGWRHTLTVINADPYSATVTVPMRALPIAGNQESALAGIVVVFIVGGAVSGHGSRRIVIQRQDAPAAPPPGSAPPEPPTGGAIALDGSTQPADLEIVISKPDHDPVTGRYQITFSSKHGVPLPAAPLLINLGTDAASFTQQILDQIVLYYGEEIQETTILGQGRTISDQLPPEFWSPIHAVAKLAKDRLPSVLIVSVEPYIPWELAVMRQPLDAERPAYLGAQTMLGRWLMAPNSQPRPPQNRLVVKSMATMVGRYRKESGMETLPLAEREATALHEQYRAIPLEANQSDLIRLLNATLDPNPQGSTGVEAIHFAGHGVSNPTEPGSAAILLSDGKSISPYTIRGGTIGESHQPFMFLNACMVGTSGELLGGAGGYPNACLLAGFRALLGPLWAVEDTVAHHLALEFYRRAFGGEGMKPEPVGSILADFRRRAKGALPGGFEPTFLAYSYYGHPELILEPGWAH